MGHHTRGHDDSHATDLSLDEHLAPALMAPQERVAELGAILDAGICRLRSRSPRVLRLELHDGLDLGPQEL